jgi:hypothetical protein
VSSVVQGGEALLKVIRCKWSDLDSPTEPGEHTAKTLAGVVTVEITQAWIDAVHQEGGDPIIMIEQGNALNAPTKYWISKIFRK